MTIKRNSQKGNNSDGEIKTLPICSRHTQLFCGREQIHLEADLPLETHSRERCLRIDTELALQRSDTPAAQSRESYRRQRNQDPSM